MKTLVTESISKTVVTVYRPRIAFVHAPVGDDSATLRFNDPNDDSDVPLISVDPVDEDLANFRVRRD